MGRHLLAVSNYIGVPYLSGGRSLEGWDCWGAVQHVSLALFDRRLPAYCGYTDACERNEVIPIFEREMLVDWQSVTEEQAGDVVVFRILGAPTHCGLVIDPPLMIHCLRGRATVLESYRSIVWRDRIEGFYRWPMAD